MKLTRTGKIFVAVVAVIVLILGYFTVFSGDDAPPDLGLDRPAKIPAPFKFPLTGAQAQQFDVRAHGNREKLDVCQFFTHYATNRGIPIQFEALIPDDARQSPYFYTDPRTGREFWPAYYVPATSTGVSEAQAIASGDTEKLEGCAQDANGAPVPILIGFARGQKPTGNLIRVNGVIWWDSLQLNPRQRITAAGAETADAPVVLAGEAQRISALALQRPAFKERVLNFAFRHGKVALRVSRVEFASDQTRVWVELINKTATPLPAWSGVNQASLRQDGGPTLTVGLSSDEGGPTADDTDTLPDEDLPPRGAGNLSGYLIFPEVDPGRTVFLNLPEVDADLDNGVAPVTIRLDPDLNVDVS